MGELKTLDLELHIAGWTDYRYLALTYDELGAVTVSQIETTEPPGSITREFQYPYDLTTGTFTRLGPDGLETVVQLDVANRVQSLVRRVPGGAELMRADYTHYANGLVQMVTYGNGAVTEYAYDDASRAVEIDHRNQIGASLLRLVYTYDERNLPTSIVEYPLSGSMVITAFEYDDRGRLIGESRSADPPYDLAYEYDQGGNRTRKIDAYEDIEIIYTYDIEEPLSYGSANNRLMYYETFDTSGQASTLLSTTYYYYNFAGNVTRIVTNPYGTEDYLATRFSYAGNAATVSYVVGESWQWDGWGCPTNYDIIYARQFRYDAARARYLVRELDTDDLLLYPPVATAISDVWSDYDGDNIYGDFTVDGQGNPTVERWYEPGIARSSMPFDPVGTEYYHSDMIGTTRLMTDSDAGDMYGAAYTAFGERITGENHRFGYAGSSGYQAHRFDEVGTLDPPLDPDEVFPYLHVGARYYDPATGRFLQRDPIGVLGGLNVYLYANGNPLSSVDPWGLYPWGPTWDRRKCEKYCGSAGARSGRGRRTKGGFLACGIGTEMCLLNCQMAENDVENTPYVPYPPDWDPFTGPSTEVGPPPPPPAPSSGCGSGGGAAAGIVLWPFSVLYRRVRRSTKMHNRAIWWETT